jgi:FkbM family methyltransferase
MFGKLDMKILKKFVKTFVRGLGYDIVPYLIQKDFDHVFTEALSRYQVGLVLDVGANAGQFASGLRTAGYGGAIISFEPMSAEHANLVLLSKNDAKWCVAPRMAIGDSDGIVEINIAANSGSSSILPMLDLHRDAAPESIYAGKESANVRKLDTVAKQLIDPSEKNIFLKLDVQGYEWSVLDGAEKILERVAGILCECSFSPLYAGEARWTSLIEKIEEKGFEVWGVLPGFSDPRTGRLLQADFLFFRKS